MFLIMYGYSNDNKGNQMKRIISGLLALLVVLGLFSACKAEEPAKSEIFALNTYVTQKEVYGKEKQAAVDEVNEFIREVEQKLSLYVTGSDVDRINQNAGISPVKVEDYTFELIQTGKRYSKLSDGRFDITIAPLTTLWGITSENPRVPSQEEIDAARKLVDYQKIRLDEAEKTVMLEEKGMALDLGGIAKGYISNAIKEIYDRHSITSALVSIGGNIDTYGRKPDGKLFKLGIRDPKDRTGMDYIGKLQVENKVVSTSGAYERYFTDEATGKTYHHILDPKTGYPADSDLQSVTVISDNGGLSDYLSTTLFMAGREHIADYIHDGRFDVIVIDRDDNVYLSDGIRDSFELTSEDYLLHE